MYRKLLAFALLLIAYTGKAQIQIGNAEIPTMNRAGSLSESDVEELKKTTTVFILQSGDERRREEFEKAIGQVWKITPFKVIVPAEMDNYAGKTGFSYFGFGGFIIQTSGRSTTSTNTHLTYDLWMPKYNKKGEQKGRNIYARFLLSPDVATLSESRSAVGNGRKARERQGDFVETMYNSSKFSNWGPGFLKGYLKVINRRLKNADRESFFSEERNDELMAEMVKDTLFVPNYVNNHYSMFSGEETEGEEPDTDEVGDAYPYPIKYVDEGVLNKMILNRTKPFYYLVYVRSSTDKYVSVFEGVSGKIAYSNHTSASYNFKKKDLSKLAKSLRKNQ